MWTPSQISAFRRMPYIHSSTTRTVLEGLLYITNVIIYTSTVPCPIIAAPGSRWSTSLRVIAHYLLSPKFSTKDGHSLRTIPRQTEIF